jgi:antirestriction protein ArdC
MAKDPRDVMAEKLVEMMTEQGEGFWSRPWSVIRQRNAATGRPYQGINALYLAALCAFKGFAQGLWVTWKEMQALGGHPLNDQWEAWTEVIWIRPDAFQPKDDEGKPVVDVNGDPVVKRYWKRGLHRVWNVAQTTVEPKRFAKYVVENKNVPDAEIEAWVSAVMAGGGCPAKVMQSNEAAYVPFLDTITMPALSQFVDRDAYYSTLFHEMGHSTGSKKRLARGLDTRFGSPTYAEEELVAEFTSAFLVGEFGLTGHPRHAAYLAHWVKRCQERPRLVWDAVSAAKKAVDFLKAAAEKGEKVEPKVEKQQAA